MTPTPADLAAELETVRKPRPLVIHTKKGDLVGPDPKYADACELLARWLAENAGRLLVAKGLEWSKETLVNKRDRHLVASGAFGTLMTVTEDGQKDKWVYNPDCSDYFGGNNIPCDSLADGKAKCEAIYADRLAAALAPAFPTKGEQ